MMKLPIVTAAAFAALLDTGTARAGTSPYLGEIDTFAFNFCPAGWLPTQGQILTISQNTALFQVLGTTYGGNGTTTFALPIVKPIFTISPGAPQLTECIAVQGVFPSRN